MRPFTTSRFLPVLAFAALAANSPAQELLGLDFGGTLHRIDARTGLTTPIGGTGVYGEFWTSLAQDSAGRLFSSYGYYNVPYKIYELDPATGQATFAFQTPFIGVSGMAFGPNDLLYVLEDPSAPLGHGLDELFTVDLATGATVRIGATGLIQITTLDFDDQGRLWAWDPSPGLVEIDLATGAARDINPAFHGPPAYPEALVFGEDDAMWMVDAGVWIGDRITGVPALVAYTSSSTVFGGIEYVPGATPPFSLWTSGKSGGPMGVRAVGASPGGTVAILITQGGGGPTAIPGGYPCAGTLLDLNARFSPLRILPADAQGRVHIGPLLVPSTAAPTTHLQAVDLQTCRTSNHARIIF